MVLNFSTLTLALTTPLTVFLPLAAHAAEVDTTQNTTPQLVLKQDFERTDSIREWRLQIPTDVKPNSHTRDNSPNAAHAGQAALKYEVTQDSDKERFIYSGAKLPTTPNTTERRLRVRLYARTASTAADQIFTFRVLERDDTKPTGWIGGKTDVIKIEPSTEWREYSFTGKLATATQGIILYVVAKKAQGGQAVWVDDLSVEVIPSAAQ